MKPYEDFMQIIKTEYDSLNKVLVDETQTEEQAVNVFRKIVEICIPKASEILSDRDYCNLWKKYDQRVRNILNQPIDANNCYYFIDYALVFATDNSSELSKLQSYDLFCAFDNTVESLYIKVTENKDIANKFQHSFESKIKEAVTDGPKRAQDDNNSSFKNYVNEITFFNHIANSTHIGLVGIEETLPNGKKADFHLVCGDNDYYVDTITIHNTSQQEDINRFIKGKVKDKYKLKMNGIQDKEVLNRFRVLPIIEYNDDRLIDYVPNLPCSLCFPPVMTLMEGTANEPIIRLELLPLTEETKQLLINNK